MGIEIHLLGRPAILGADGAAQPVRGHQAWALLARILLSPRPLDRRAIAAELFPDAVDPLGALRWCLASLRRALNAPEALTGDPILGNLPEGVCIDAAALERGEIDVDALGDLLEGVEPRCGDGFATWLLVERERTAGQIDAAIRQETLRAVASGDHDRAIRLAERGVRRSPFDEGAHVLLVRSLALAGRVDAANRHVDAVERSFRAELGLAPSAALRSAAAAPSRSTPPPGVSARAMARSLLETGRAALGAGAAAVALDDLRRAVGMAVDDPALEAETLLALGAALVHAVRGRDDEGAILLRRSVDLSKQAGAPALAATGLCELGYVETMAGRRPAAASCLAEALALAVEAGDPPHCLAAIHAVIGFNLVDWDRIEDGLGHFALSLDNARRAGDRRREAWALGLGAWGHLAATRPDAARDWAKDSLAIVDDLRYVAFRPWPMAVLVEAEMTLGAEPASLRPRLEEAFALSCQLVDPCWESAAARVMALTYARERRWDRAIDWLAEARSRGARETDAYAALMVAIVTEQAAVSLDAGRIAEADRFAREALSMAARTHTDKHVGRVAAMLARTARNSAPRKDEEVSR